MLSEGPKKKSDVEFKIRIRRSKKLQLNVSVKGYSLPPLLFSLVFGDYGLKLRNRLKVQRYKLTFKE
jgi:hypothetical protein